MSKAPNTLISRLGFQDDELKTPKHDEIMLWLDGYVSTFVEKWCRMEQWPKADLERVRALVDRSPSLGPVPAPDVSSVRSKVWEHPITSGRGYIDAFIDLLVVIDVPCIWTVTCNRCGFGRDNAGCEDCYIGVGVDTITVAFDVKPTIPSLGELIRQVRFYEAKFKADRFIVVSPETRWTDALVDQGVGFLDYPGGTYVRPVERRKI